MTTYMTLLYSRNTCDAWNKLHQMTGEGTHHVTDGVGWLYEQKVFFFLLMGYSLGYFPSSWELPMCPSLIFCRSIHSSLSLHPDPRHEDSISLKFFALKDFFTSPGITVFKSLLEMIDFVVSHASGGIRRQNSINEKSRFHPKKHLRLTFFLKDVSWDTFFWKRDNFFLFIY